VPVHPLQLQRVSLQLPVEPGRLPGEALQVSGVVLQV